MKVCEQYGTDHNLDSSTDLIPPKSKTKGIYFCGEKNKNYPDKILLNGEPLPWVVTGLHLGHTLHQDGTMEQDSVKVRQKLMFAGQDMML